MKKIILTAVIFAIAIGSVFAERLYLIQGTYLTTSRGYEYINDEVDNYGEFGINFTSFNGQGLGFYSSATFLLPVEYSYEVNGSDQGFDIDDLTAVYDDWTLGMDLMLGVGMNIPITPFFNILAAGGLHFNGIVLMSTNYLVDPFLSYVAGPGAAVNAMLFLTPNLNINVSAMAAWDLFEFVRLPELDSNFTATGGVTVALSAGLGFKY